MKESDLPEPWLRGTLTEVPVIARAVLHALQLAREDYERWLVGLTDDELNARPLGLNAVAFELRHISRTLDRLLTYAEDRQITEQQLMALKTEVDERGSRDAVLNEFSSALHTAAERIRALADIPVNAPRFVGRKCIPTTVGGLLVHVAEHTHRHIGQAIATAKVLISQKSHKGDGSR